jgi:hypothetical protein
MNKPLLFIGGFVVGVIGTLAGLFGYIALQLSDD